jgi:DNA-binding beta-propeller fold protein YncE
MFNYRGNGNDFFVDEPLLEPLAAVLFVFGFLVAMTRVLGLWRPRSAGYGATVLSDRRPLVFILIGLAMALLPGLLAIPNGNRCIAALPFVYMLIAIGAVTLVETITRPLAERTRDTLQVVLLAGLIACAGVETYREYLGTNRRPVLGFGPEATAAGEYMRGFGDGYTRYVIAEDWPEYTLAYLSYNGGGTPLENHYVLGRRLEDIEPRINRFGRKGLVFLTDLKPAGRHALERLQRLFAEHRIESVRAPRLGGEQVAQALIVEPQGAGHTGLWSNTTRALSLGGDAAATAVACFDAVGDAQGVSVRLQLMRPDPCAANGGAPAARGGEVRVLASCPPDENAAPLAVGFSADGLEVRAPASGRDGAAVTLVDAAAVEAGRWYEVAIAVRPDGGMSVSIDGNALPGAERLKAPGAPLRIAGAEISAPAGEHLFVDDLAIVPGLVRPGAALWAEAKNAFHEDFETLPYGLIAADAEWRRVEGPVSALASPAAEQAAAPAANGGNAFDGGHGSSGGEFNDPVGLTVDPDGHLYVADKNNHRVQQFDRAGAFLRAWGEKGDQPGMFNEPHDVAADAEFVYVADTWNQRVQVFDHSGAHVFTITGVPSLTSPRGVFVKDKLIYIAEAGAGRVTVYDRAGKLRQTIGVLGGDAPGHLVEPVAVAVDHAGDVWVVNSGNNRIEHFAPDGTVRGSIPVPGWTDPRLKESYLAVGDDGTLYLGDWDRGAVRRFRPDGTELTPLGTSIRKPSGVVVERNRVLVVARGEDVVRVLPLDAGGGA